MNQGNDTTVIQEENNMTGPPATSPGLQELESRPVHLKMREEENKLSFQKRLDSNNANRNKHSSAAGHYMTAEETTVS